MLLSPRAKWCTSDRFKVPAWRIALCDHPSRVGSDLVLTGRYGDLVFARECDAERAAAAVTAAGIVDTDQIEEMTDQQIRELVYRDLAW